MTDGQRIDFLADLMDSNVRLQRAPHLMNKGEREQLDRDSRAIFQAYEFHRRHCDTRTAFRLAVEDAVKAAESRPEPKA